MGLSKGENMRRLLILAIIAVSACSSAQTKPEVTARPETVRVVGGTGMTTSVGTTTSDHAVTTKVDALPARVWQALPIVFDSLAIDVAHLDQQARVIGNRDLKVRGKLGKMQLRRIVDCGSAQGAPSADTYEVSLSVMTQVQPADSVSTNVSTLMQAVARPVNFAGDYVRCLSTRVLESELINVLSRQLAR
jgi:uncharacterized protein YggE